MILVPLPANLSTGFLPKERAKKAAFFFAYGDNPSYLDTARTFANLALENKFDHIIIFTDTDCTKTNYMEILAQIASICEANGLCWIGISTHGNIENNVGSTIEFCCSSGANGIDPNSKMSSVELHAEIRKINEKVRLLLTFDACQSNSFAPLGMEWLGHFLLTLLPTAPGQFQFPGLFLNNRNESISETNLHGANSAQVIVIGVDGFGNSDCDDNHKGCFAGAFSAALVRTVKPQTYKELADTMIDLRPSTAKFTYTYRSENANSFEASVPLS